ncbi:hypothetical protein OVA10_03540 [Lelliottia sp. SL45]|uniref:hypothetical protein n=1 Tax=Lelliottia sp. SL45 TaxID=2994665 RepID=UPI00227249B7|nr:hypothetical protein [Lelliottia sp. SL45]MCY1697162.1 hypothetical protein [Lelliottia sp. SL45]
MVKRIVRVVLFSVVGFGLLFAFAGFMAKKGKEMKTFQDITLGKTHRELKVANICKLEYPIGVPSFNRNVNRVKYDICDDYQVLGQKRRVHFEFIDGKLTQATIFMGFDDWKAAIPALEKQYGKASRTVDSDDVEAQFNDSRISFTRVYFGKSKNIAYHFQNLGGSFESIILQIPDHDKIFDDVKYKDL